jgi:hypothetical protein
MVKRVGIADQMRKRQRLGVQASASSANVPRSPAGESDLPDRTDTVERVADPTGPALGKVW